MFEGKIIFNPVHLILFQSYSIIDGNEQYGRRYYLSILQWINKYIPGNVKIAGFFFTLINRPSISMFDIAFENY